MTSGVQQGDAQNAQSLPFDTDVLASSVSLPYDTDVLAPSVSLPYGTDVLTSSVSATGKPIAYEYSPLWNDTIIGSKSIQSSRPTTDIALQLRYRFVIGSFGTEYTNALIYLEI